MLINPSNVISEQPEEEASATNSEQKNTINCQKQNDIILRPVQDIPNTKIILFSNKTQLTNAQFGVLTESVDNNALNLLQASKDTDYLVSSIPLNELSDNKKPKEIVQVQTAHSAFTYIETNPQENRQKIFYREIENYYLSLFLSSENEIVVKEVNEKECCLYRLLYIFNDKYTLSNDLCREREYFLFLSKITFDSSFDLHANVITTIFYAFNEDYLIKNSTSNISLKEMMERLFIDDDNTQLNNDLSILPMIYSMILIDKYHYFLRMNLEKMTNKATGHNYLFVLIKQIADILVNIIKSEKVIIYFNQKKSVSNTMNEFYLGLIEQAMAELNSQFENMKEIDKELISMVENKIRFDALSFPSEILWKYKIFIEKYPEDKDSVSFDSIHQDSR